MKRLLILTVLGLAAASSSGCWHWFNRGAQCNPCAPATSTYADPCAPGIADPAMMPGPVTTVVPAQ